MRPAPFVLPAEAMRNDVRFGQETPHTLVASYGLSFQRTGKTDQRTAFAL